MKIDKNTATIIIALITASAGLGTALINRYSTNEGAVVESERSTRKGYNATRKAIVGIADDVDSNVKRLDMLENTIILQNQTIQALLSGRTLEAKAPEIPKELRDRKRNRNKRKPRKRAAPPTFDATQSAR
jgi:hypothetical protein